MEDRMSSKKNDLDIFERIRLEIGDKLILKGVEISDLCVEDLDILIQAKLLDEEMGIDSFQTGSMFQARLLSITGV